MRILILLERWLYLCLLGLALMPAPLRADPWSWLDDPERQYWSQITFHGYGPEIRFSIPDNAKRSGTHPVRVPRLEKGQRDQEFTVPPDYFDHVGKMVIGFDWERYWGGFFKKSLVDYSLRVRVNYIGQDAHLLAMDTQGRIDRVYQHFEGLYAPIKNQRAKDFFFNRFHIEPYQSQQGYVWTVENSPTVVQQQEYFRLPITDQHEMVFWFYYRWEDGGGRGDPAWLERRKALSRQILDSVRISPDPYAD